MMRGDARKNGYKIRVDDIVTSSSSWWRSSIRLKDTCARVPTDRKIQCGSPPNTHAHTHTYNEKVTYKQTEKHNNENDFIICTRLYS